MKLKLFSTILLSFLIGQNVMAQTLLYGAIKDKSGEALVGVTVALKGSKIGALTDMEGNYKLKIEGTGKTTILISYIGYKTKTETIELNNATIEKNYVLEEDAFNLDQVVVTGTNTTRTQKEMTASLSQLNSKQIQAINANSMADIIRVIPGVHAEGGGGEVASNIMVRGLPSGGQYKYTPIEEDGMPVQATGYLTSSAQDVFFRPDLGVGNFEFARGGSSTLFGNGSPVGVFNYISKKGGGEGESIVKLSTGQFSLYRVDFNTGGSAGDKWQYNISGFARYDEGPLLTGANSKGYQIRANITRQLDNGYVRLYVRSLDDGAQFYLPVPHVKQEKANENTVQAATGNDGQVVQSLYSPQMGVFSLVNPLGTIQGNLGNGVTAKGVSTMLEFAKQFGGWDVKSKTRLSSFNHTFDFWSPGRTFEIETYAKARNANLKSYTFNYADNGLPMALSNGANNGKTYVSEASITLRNRPMKDLSTDLRITKQIKSNNSEHNLTFGTYGSSTSQLQDEVGTGVLLEMKNMPRLVDLSIIDANNVTTRYTKGGFRQNVAGRTNNTFEANRMAFYAGDEMVFGKLRIDAGLRYEVQKGIVTVGETAAYTNPAATNTADASYRWQTGKVFTRKFTVDDFGYVLGANYSVNNSLNLYGSLSKGYYFPELRTFSNVNRDGKGEFIQVVPEKNEAVYQYEIGAKYSSPRISGTMALYYNNIKNRLQNEIIAGADGVLREITRPVGLTTTKGVEITAAVKLVDGLIADVNATLQDHEYVDFKRTTSGADGKLGTDDDVITDYKGNWVLRQPKTIFNIGLSYDKKGWDLGFLVNQEGKRYADDQNNVVLPAYAILNLRAGKSFKVGAKESIKVGLNVYNALNNRGLTEGDPRVADTSVITNDPFYNARPILPRRLTTYILFKF
ncbi:TonB-dependent receptor plug (plasmid) [Emticicia oligotrophica DSM 17448]|uniref:TonB-dependent receptor plug n=1 Tax=Emticicia oligotrophica (strain DSM 17448 / CIP 109782 / MTCC 6937 / GPTSA100-15) TaxID=929562 RepID=A0ABM5N875_EMTOG|nr:TonB-dependent receptor [Emticicia oligotrophica]AFK05732.1 TonB-dependent receptor plug [Emticicia oligotrophica DSM 17448]